MYEQVFQFRDRPFASIPFAEHYFPASSIDAALNTARICISHSSGPVMVVGQSGYGKSMLLTCLDHEYQNEFKIANIVGCTRMSKRLDLLQNILFELGQPYLGMSEGELRLALIDYLKPRAECPHGILMLVDDAHTLPSRLLDEIRLIINFVRDGQPRVRLVMAGNQKLEEKLAHPQLESFNQRIAGRCLLENLRRDEVEAYILHQVARAGQDSREIFQTEAIRAVADACDGNPRLINQVCDHALILCASAGKNVVTRELVHEAWTDLQRLPGPWESLTSHSTFENHETNTIASEGVVEFGGLSDEIVSDESTAQNAAADEAVTEEVLAEEVLADEVVTEEVVTEEVMTEEDLADDVATDEIARAELNEVAPASEQMSNDDSTPHEAVFESENRYPNDPVETVDSDSAEFQADVAAEEATKREVELIKSIASQGLNDIVSREIGESISKEACAETPQESQSDPEAASDPFNEQFIEEEVVADHYSQVSAEQNRATVDLSEHDLNSLLTEVQKITQELSSDPPPHPSATNEVADVSTSVPTAGVAKTEVPKPETPTLDRPSPKPETPTLECASPKPETPTLDLARPKPETPTLDLASTKPETPTLNLASPLNSEVVSPTVSADMLKLFDNPEKLAEQISIASKVPRASAKTVVDIDLASMQIEYPVTQHTSYNEMGEQPDEMNPEDQIVDDRDMLIVSQLEAQNVTPKVDDEEADAQAPVSKGTAFRMNYQQLFEQLKSEPPEVND